MPRLIRVIECETVRGDGSFSNRNRVVVQYYRPDGKFLAELDPGGKTVPALDCDEAGKWFVRMGDFKETFGEGDAGKLAALEYIYRGLGDK